MIPVVRDTLKNAFEAGYFRALTAVVSGDLGAVAQIDDLEAAARGAAAEYVAELVAAEREAAA